MGQGLDGLKAFVCLEATSKNYGFVRICAGMEANQSHKLSTVWGL